jgi:dolichol-phosphate mannosyltransferase
VNKPDISVVVPLYNEEDNVEALERELDSALGGLDHELILVDDGSTDRTAERIRPRPGVRLLRLAANAGQSAALLAGMRASNGSKIVLLDGDLQNDPSDIPRLLAGLGEGADMVCGYRRRRRDSLSKVIASRIANFVRSRFVGDGIRDTGCTLKAMRRECLEAIVPFHGVHRFLPALVKQAGFRVTEIPVNHRARRFGSSKYGIGNRALRATVDMFGVRWLQARRLVIPEIRETP